MTTTIQLKDAATKASAVRASSGDDALAARPLFPQPSLASSVAAAALSAMLGVGMISGVTYMLRHDGLPFERIVIAEPACRSLAYESEREACMREWLDTARGHRVAASR